MDSVYVDPALDDDRRRTVLFEGQLVVHSAVPGSLALVEHARDMIRGAFGDRDPETAQFEMPVDEYVALLADLKPRFIHDPRSKDAIRRILADLGADPSETYFDVPRLRSSTSHGYLTTGIAYAFHPHRDTWYSAPMAQVNWWIPIYPVVRENAVAFHPRYFDRHVANDSWAYDYAEWTAVARPAAASQIGRDTRRQPHPEEEIDLEPQVRVITPPGGILQFSGSQLHSSVPNVSCRTRWSIDFRTVHRADLEAGRGAPNVDCDCTGTTLGDFLRASDGEHLPAELIARFDLPPNDRPRRRADRVDAWHEPERTLAPVGA